MVGSDLVNMVIFTEGKYRKIFARPFTWVIFMILLLFVHKDVKFSLVNVGSGQMF